MHAVGGGQGGFGFGGFNLSNILRNFKGINWGGFTRDAGVGGPNGDFGGETDNPAGGKITGVNGLAGGALMAGGMFLAQRGLLGSSRGTWGGVAQGALGGAMVGFAVGGPIGAAIGAGIGAGIGIGEKMFGVESPENEAKRLVKQLYSISIDNSMAKQIAGIAQQKYAGHVSVAVRDPDVRKMLMLYSQATGQKMPLSATTPQSASLAEMGGQALPAGDLRERHAVHVPEQSAGGGRVSDRNLSDAGSHDAAAERLRPGRGAVRGRPGRDAGVRAGAVVERGGGQQWAVAELGDDAAAGAGDCLRLNFRALSLQIGRFPSSRGSRNLFSQIVLCGTRIDHGVHGVLQLFAFPR